MQGKTIILGVSGGIAVYKAAALASRLTQAGALVHVVMTESACKFVTPLTFQALTKQEVYLDTFAERNPHVISHIDLADRADLFLMVPATANVIGKLAHGIADDMLLTTWLATTAPTMVAPAMNGHMLVNPAVRHNIELLKMRGVMFVEPAEGQLACGYVGKGRLAEPEHIFAEVERFFADRARLSGVRVLITAGGTREPIDPVRFIGNHSSGKMGHALATVAADRGALVELITAADGAPHHPAIRITRVDTAQQMYDAVMQRVTEVDVIIKSAAVADYRPAESEPSKIKKNRDRLTLEFVKNPDILAELGARPVRPFLVGFAAETDRLDEHAQEKLRRKRCDLLVANDVSVEGAGFSADTNIVSIFDSNGLVERLPVLSKTEVARRILQLVADRRDARDA